MFVSCVLDESDAALEIGKNDLKQQRAHVEA
jgi:hypothetical protein